MPRAKKVDQQIPTPTLDVASSIVPLERTSSSGTYRVAKDVISALTDDDSERNNKPLHLFANELGEDLSEGEITARQLGIRFKSSSAHKLFGILLKKHADTIEIKDGVARQVVENTSDEHRVEIRDRLYRSPFIEVSVYELVKEMAPNRKESGRDYEDCWRSLEELQTTNHCFTMKLRTSQKDEDGKTVNRHGVSYAPVITSIVRDLTDEEVQAIENELQGLEDTESSRRPHKRLRIYLHPITIHQLGNWFTLIPNDFEEKLTAVGAGKSPHIRQLAWVVLGERGLDHTKTRGYFELGKNKLIAKLQLEKYRTRRKDLDGKLAAAFDALKGWLIDRVELRPAVTGGDKYRIYPRFDSVNELKNGAA